jgi:hypothetical protein
MTTDAAVYEMLTIAARFYGMTGQLVLEILGRRKARRVRRQVVR